MTRPFPSLTSRSPALLLGLAGLALAAQTVTAPIGTIISEQSRTAFSMQGAGARAMGLEHALGSLTEGKLADFVVIDMRRVHLTPCVNPLGNIVHVGQGRDVELVVVAGRIVVEDGQSTLVDSEAIRREGQRAAQALWARC